MFPVLKIEIEKSNQDGMLYAKISEDEREYPILQLVYEDYDEICAILGVTPTNEKDELTITVEADEGGCPSDALTDSGRHGSWDEIPEDWKETYRARAKGAPRER